MGKRTIVVLALIDVLAERIKELLPPGEFEVTTDGEVLRIAGLGRWYGSSLLILPTISLRLPLPVTRRLHVFLVNAAMQLQEFVSKVRGEQWPYLGATPQVNVGSEIIRIWWQDQDNLSPDVEIKPIDWLEIENDH